MDQKLKHLFLPLVSENSDDDNVAIYVSQRDSLAFGGFRRSWGLGDFFVRYMGPIEDFNYSGIPGVYHFSTETYSARELLPGARLPDGTREGLDERSCQNIFGTVYAQVNGHHQLLINPKQVLEFIERRTMKTGVGERVINIQAFEGVNSKGQFAAPIEIYEGQQVIGFRTPQGKVPMYIDHKNSLFPTERIPTGEWVVVEPSAIVEGVRYVRVLRLHEPGIRMAIQHLKSGLLMPGDPRYSIHEGENNNTITELDVKTFRFLEGQDRSTMKDMPMMTIQLDTFVRSLKAMSPFKRVIMAFKNSHTPYLMTPYTDDGVSVDVVASSFSPYKSGKVVTL